MGQTPPNLTRIKQVHTKDGCPCLDSIVGSKEQKDTQIYGPHTPLTICEYVTFDITSDSVSFLLHCHAFTEFHQSLYNKCSTLVIVDRLCSWVCQRCKIRVCINAADSRKSNMNNLQQRRMRVMTLMCALFSFSLSF